MRRSSELESDAPSLHLFNRGHVHYVACGRAEWYYVGA
jgi:hypothetical protein